MDLLEKWRAWVAASERSQDHIRLYTYREYNRFDSVKLIPVRRLDTLYLAEELKKSLLDDMEIYLSSTNERFHAAHGIPYRRGYLFHGPPGTGKSSLANALAGHFDLPLYILDLGNMNDDAGLHKTFDNLPPRSIVLLEAVDATKVAQSRKTLARYSGGASITLSALLNVLDSVASPWVRIIIMTTNHVDDIDPALKRAGRADKHLYIGYMTRECAKKIFHAMLGDSNESGNDEKLEEMAETFSQHIPEDLIAPAEMERFLLSHRGNPAQANKDVVAWVAEQRVQFGEMKAQGSGDGNDEDIIYDHQL